MEIERPYFVDIFEVEGGSVHDYAIRGSVWGDTVGHASLPVEPLPAERPLLELGEKWQEPRGMGALNHYGLFRNVRAGKPAQDFHVDFTLKDAPDTGTRTHLFRDDATQLFLGETPALRRAGHYKDDEVYNWQMPHLIVRRKGARGLKTTFVAVCDLLQGGPKVTAVQRLKQDEGMVALEISLAGRTDTLLYALGEPQAMSASGVETDGKLALVSERGGQAEACLVAGTRLRKGKVELSTKQASYRGTLVGATRKLDGAESNAFVVDAELPVGTALRGKWLVVTHGRVAARFGKPVKPDEQGANGTYGTITHAYEIDRIEKRDGKTRVHLARDHGLRVAGNRTTEVFSMWRAYDGPETFVIHLHERLPHRGPSAKASIFTASAGGRSGTKRRCTGPPLSASSAQ